MTKHTSRDDVWSEALKLAEVRRQRRGLGRRSTFTPGEVAARIDDPPSDRTVRDVVATMADKSHLERARTQGRYRHPDAGSGRASGGVDDVQEELADDEIRGAVDDVQEDPTGDVEAVDAVDTPALTLDRETFEDAAYAILAELRADGPLGRKEFQQRLHDDHAAGYDNERTWWRRVAKPVLEAHPDLEAPPGGQPWRFPE